MYQKEDIYQGFETAYLDDSVVSNTTYRPQFLSNNRKEGKKVLSSIEDELLACDEFQISAAFITMSGLVKLLQILKELEQKNIKGKILTTNYLNFSEPKALKLLNSFPNITLKMYDTEGIEEGFHTKGYIFKKDNIYKIIIGSSNITSSALTSNKEWNTKLICTEHGEMSKQIMSEFEEMWNSERSLLFDEFFDNYSKKYELIKKQREQLKIDETRFVKVYKLEPNSMQLGFIENLKKIINVNKDNAKALLISATGTGKTYASAFAMRELGFKKVLFLVHRGQLAKQSRRSFDRVFSRKVRTGLVGFGHYDYDADYVFATVQTLSKDKHLFEYDANRFDCIIIDEAHHVPSETYQKIIDHFKPKLLLGMTATPDKRDDNKEGKNVYELFNYNIAYEIRLQQAMEENLLCPFNYFGITDLTVVDDTSDDEIDFSMLTSDQRVKHIVDQATYYGYCGDKVKGLVFCRGIKETEVLSEKFNKTINPETGKYFRTIALNGNASEDERQDAFERLAMDETDDSDDRTPLDYIFSYEILNEGVDIVEVNQVIMLRPTQSPIVFIQQLGRGLRKAEGKEYVVILDFIGNYKNNFMIPIALSGDRTYNKDNIRRYVMEGERVIPGESTIHFDEISRKKIFASVDNANFSDVKLIKENYKNLKNKLGRIPYLGDFDKFGEMDVQRIFDNNSLGSYYNFLVKHEKEYSIRIGKVEEEMIEFVSKKLSSGKRIHELLLLKTIIDNETIGSDYDLREKFEERLSCCNLVLNPLLEKSIINVLTNEFPNEANKKTYKNCVFLSIENDKLMPDEKFIKMLDDDNFKYMLIELIEFGISRYFRDYFEKYKDTDLVLYKKYTYEDVCRLLNWEKNIPSLNIGGYKYDEYSKTFPVFINYEKANNISDSTKYEDHFTSPSSLIAISKSGRTLASNDVQNFINSESRGIKVELFVRKNKDDNTSKEFYYLGEMVASGKTKEFIMENTDKSAVEIEWILDVPVRDDIYNYIVNG